MLATIPVDFALYAILVVYTVIALVRNDQTLLTTQAFTTVSLVSILSNPLLSFIQTIPQITQSIGCFERIENYCSRERSHKVAFDGMDSSKASLDGVASTELSTMNTNHEHQQLHKSVVSFQDATISWASESEDVLHDLTLSIPRGNIVMIVGPVGCGKSAFLESILGRTNVKLGHVHLTESRFAYCPQAPWIMNASIQLNITGGKELDQKWYDLTLSACALTDDLDNFPNGDMFMAGSNGISLSGGQKQRVVSVLMYSFHHIEASPS